MLELLESSQFHPFANLIEDNVCRLLPLSVDGAGSNIGALNSSVYDVATVRYILSVFFSHVAPIPGAGKALETYSSTGLPRSTAVPIPWVRTSRTSNPLLSVGVRQPSAALHPNIAALLYQWEIPAEVAPATGKDQTDSEGDRESHGQRQRAILLVQEYVKRSLSALLMFHKSTSLTTPTLCRSAGAGAKDLRCRFLAYQLLQTVAYVHSQGLCLEGNFGPSRVLMDDNMWVVLPVEVGPRMAQCAAVARGGPQPSLAELRALLGFCSAIPRPPGYYDSLVTQWVSGRVSNFEYLMRLNDAAGRNIIDPVHHPVLPWLTDFSVDLLGFNNDQPLSVSPLESDEDRKEARRKLFEVYLRDLSQSKFRLSKGDDQLQTTYNVSLVLLCTQVSCCPPRYCSYIHFVDLSLIIALDSATPHSRVTFGVDLLHIHGAHHALACAAPRCAQRVCPGPLPALDGAHV